MANFETSIIYRLNVAGRFFIERDGAVYPVDYERVSSSALMPFWADGVEKYDFAVFADVADELDAKNIGFLVVTAGCGQGLLASTEAICLDPENLLSPELAKKLASTSLDEIAQFGNDLLNIQKLSEHLHPHARGFGA